MLAPIVSNKHYVHRSNVSVASGSIQNNIVSDAVAGALANAFDVEEGSVIKAVHLELWVCGDESVAGNSQFALIVEKLPTGNPLMTYAQSLNLGSYPNKKNILFTSQGVMNDRDNNTQGIPLIRNWQLIPKGKQRQGLGDRIVVNVAPTGGALNFCGLFTYKEYR